LVRPDLVDEHLRIVAEADSFEHHGSRTALAIDCARYDNLVADGWTVLRFAWEQVMYRPDWVRGALAAVTRRRLAAPETAAEAVPAASDRQTRPGQTRVCAWTRDRRHHRDSICLFECRNATGRRWAVSEIGAAPSARMSAPADAMRGAGRRPRRDE
jgi:hypothetical protein